MTPAAVLFLAPLLASSYAMPHKRCVEDAAVILADIDSIANQALVLDESFAEFPLPGDTTAQFNALREDILIISASFASAATNVNTARNKLAHDDFNFIVSAMVANTVSTSDGVREDFLILALRTMQTKQGPFELIKINAFVDELVQLNTSASAYINNLIPLIPDDIPDAQVPVADSLLLLQTIHDTIIDFFLF